MSEIIGLGVLGWAAKLTMSEDVLADCWNGLVPEITGLMPPVWAPVVYEKITEWLMPSQGYVSILLNCAGPV